MKPGDMIGMSKEEGYVTLLVEVQKIGPSGSFEGRVVNGYWDFKFYPQTCTMVLEDKRAPLHMGFKVIFEGPIPDPVVQEGFHKAIAFMNAELKRPVMVRQARKAWFRTLSHLHRVKTAWGAFVQAYRAYPVQE